MSARKDFLEYNVIFDVDDCEFILTVLGSYLKF